MDADDLNAPLGQDKDKPKPKLPIGAPHVLASLLGLFGLAVLGWALFGHDPLGGEPVAVVAVASDPAAAVKAEDAGDTATHSRYDGPPAVAPDAAKAAEKPAVSFS